MTQDLTGEKTLGLTRAKKNAGDVQVFCLQFARRRRNVYFYCKQKREAAESN